MSLNIKEIMDRYYIIVDSMIGLAEEAENYHSANLQQLQSEIVFLMANKLIAAIDILKIR